MIKANEHIFSSLVDFVKQNGIDIPEGIRYIKTDGEEKRWLKELKVSQKQIILPNLRTVSINFDQKEYFVVVGWDDSESFDEVLDPIFLNAGLVTALLFELEVPIRREVGPYEIADEIQYKYQTCDKEQEYSGHDFSEVSKFFEPILAYQILEESPLNGDDIIQISGFYICENNKKLSLSFSPETIGIFERVFIEGPSSIPYENLLSSLTSVRWKHSFLDIYRCIEQLFPISRLYDLHQSLGISISLLEFSAKIENSIGWRPKEDETLNKLFDELPTEARKLFSEVRYYLDSTKEGELGTWFYKIRNSIVHYRPATQQFELDDENCNKLIRGALLVIEYLYEKYNQKLSS